MIKDLLDKIKEYDTIIIHRHSRPDGDALGSQLGLKQAILDTYPEKHVYAVGDINPRISWIGDMDQVSDETYKDALAILCDTACDYMVSDLRLKDAKELFVIDHHTNPTNLVSDDHFIVDSTRAAAAELIAEILLDNNFVVSKKAASLLYTGIVTDSGRFLYNETSSCTLRIAARLLDTGFNPQEIYDKLYVETLEKKKLVAEFTNRFQVTKHNVAYLINTKETLDKYNISFNDCSRGMVGCMAGIEGINIWANFTYDQTSGKVVCEFRSRGFSIVDIAKKYGGGGHDQACGATIDNFDMVEDVLKDFDERMIENGSH